jgi:phosphatidylethanolamine N-methyltransferase
MADVKHNGVNAEGNQLRERPSAKPLHLQNAQDAKQRVLDLNNQEEKDCKSDETRRTYGRTADGTGMWLCASVPVRGREQ